MDFHIYSTTANNWIPASGEIVDVAPHLPGEAFVLHICPMRTRSELWKVTHIESGCLASLEAHGDTRENAIASATRRLAKVDREKWAGVLERTRALMNDAPPRPSAIAPEPINEDR